MGAMMCRLLDDEMWTWGGAGCRGSYSISLRGPAKKSLGKNTLGDSIPSNLFSCLVAGGGGKREVKRIK